MNKNLTLAALLSAALLALAAPAQAKSGNAVQASASCSFSDISGAGVSVTDCSGYYVGNLNSGAQFSSVKSLLAGEFAGSTLGNARIEQFNLSAGSVDFQAPVHGDTVIGIHWGGGKGGGNTAFYRLTLDSAFTGSFNVAGTNPARGFGGLSNVALYSTTTTPVPEPESYALMLAGLAAIGFLARRRKAI